MALNEIQPLQLPLYRLKIFQGIGAHGDAARSPSVKIKSGSDHADLPGARNRLIRPEHILKILPLGKKDALNRFAPIEPIIYIFEDSPALYQFLKGMQGIE